jgi:hypothetical protein
MWRLQSPTGSFRLLQSLQVLDIGFIGAISAQRTLNRQNHVVSRTSRREGDALLNGIAYFTFEGGAVRLVLTLQRVRPSSIPRKSGWGREEAFPASSEKRGEAKSEVRSCACVRAPAHSRLYVFRVLFSFGFSSVSGFLRSHSRLPPSRLCVEEACSSGPCVRCRLAVASC